MRDLFFNKERFLKDSPIRRIYALFFVLFFFITEIGCNVYRPYIYQNAIDDLRFADVIGNLFGTITIIFFQLALHNVIKKQALRITGMVTCGITVYELLQSILPRGTMDWFDVAASFIAGVLCLGMLAVIWAFVKEPELEGSE